MPTPYINTSSTPHVSKRVVTNPHIITSTKQVTKQVRATRTNPKAEVVR
jgi:hypothetical protein